MTNNFSTVTKVSQSNTRVGVVEYSIRNKEKDMYMELKGFLNYFSCFLPASEYHPVPHGAHLAEGMEAYEPLSHLRHPTLPEKKKKKKKKKWLGKALEGI